MVGLVGFEPTTPALSRRCSNRLSYRPSPARTCRSTLAKWNAPESGAAGSDSNNVVNDNR